MTIKMTWHARRSTGWSRISRGASARRVRCSESARFSRNCISSIPPAINIDGWPRVTQAATPLKKRGSAFRGRSTSRATTAAPFRDSRAAPHARRIQSTAICASTGVPARWKKRATPAALARRRVAAGKPDLPAASAPEPEFVGTPAVTGAAEFHMARLQALRALGIKELQPDELKALAGESSTIEMRRFVLAEYASADAWYDAIVAATHMEK